MKSNGHGCFVEVNLKETLKRIPKKQIQSFVFNCLGDEAMTTAFLSACFSTYMDL